MNESLEKPQPPQDLRQNPFGNQRFRKSVILHLHLGIACEKQRLAESKDEKEGMAV